MRLLKQLPLSADFLLITPPYLTIRNLTELAAFTSSTVPRQNPYYIQSGLSRHGIHLR